MLYRTVAGTAIEMPTHRRSSPIGSPQRHYRLDPPLMSLGGGRHRDVIVINGRKAAYAFAGDSTGEVADFTALVIVAAGDHGAALSALGYSLAGAA